MSAKLILAVFIINAICIFNFTTPALAATGDLNMSVSPYNIYEGESITITWTPDTLEKVGLYSYGGYYTEIWMQKDAGSLIKIAIIDGTGTKSYTKILDDYGTYKFQLKEYASYRHYVDDSYVRHVINGPFYVNNDESNMIYVEDIIDLQVSYDPISVPGNYPASYGFDDDPIGSNPSDWVLDLRGGTVNVISNLDGHNKVVKIHDTIQEQSCGIRKTFSQSQESGSAEFWVRSTDTTKLTFLAFYDEPITKTAIYFTLGNIGYFRYYDGVWHNIAPASSNTWYHVRVDFECGSGGYLGLSADTFYVHINGVQYGAYNFYNPVDSIGNNGFATDTWSSPNYDLYVDAVGYSWDPNYNVGDNLQEANGDIYEGDSVTITWDAVERPSDNDGSFYYYYNDYVSDIYLKNSDEELEFIDRIIGEGDKSHTFQIHQAGTYSVVVKIYSLSRDRFDLNDYTTKIQTGEWFVDSDENNEIIIVDEVLYNLKATPDVIRRGEQTTISWNVNPKEGFTNYASRLSRKFEDDDQWEPIITINGSGSLSRDIVLDQEGLIYFKVDLYIGDAYITSEETLISVSKTLIGATNRRFPSGAGSRLGSSIFIVNTIEDMIPRLYFGISQDLDDFVSFIEINLIIDGVTVKSYLFASMVKNILTEYFTDIEELKAPGDHKIEIEVFYRHYVHNEHFIESNSVFLLKYLRIGGLEFQETEVIDPLQLEVIFEECDVMDEVIFKWNAIDKPDPDFSYSGYYSDLEIRPIYSSNVVTIQDTLYDLGPKSVAITMPYGGEWTWDVKYYAIYRTNKYDNTIEEGPFLLYSVIGEKVRVFVDVDIKILYEADIFESNLLWWGTENDIAVWVRSALRVGFGQYFPMRFHASKDDGWMIRDEDGYDSDEDGVGDVNIGLDNYRDWAKEEHGWSTDSTSNSLGSASGGHGDNFDLLIMFVMDWDNLLIGGLSSIYGNMVVINLAWEVLGVGLPITHQWSTHYVLPQPGVLSMIMHEVGHCYGITGNGNKWGNDIFGVEDDTGDTWGFRYSVMDYIYHFYIDGVSKIFDYGHRRTIANYIEKHSK